MVESSSPGDASHLRTNKALSALERARDRLAGEIGGELDAAAFSGTGIRGAAGQTLACRALIGAAEQLAAGHWPRRRPGRRRAALAHARALRADRRRAWETSGKNPQG